MSPMRLAVSLSLAFMATASAKTFGAPEMHRGGDAFLENTGLGHGQEDRGDKIVIPIGFDMHEKKN